MFKRVEATPAPHEVFTPGKVPLKKDNAFVPRPDAEAKIDRAMQRHNVPIVFGEFGVGKTTVVQRYLQPLKAVGRLVFVASAAGLTLQKVFEICLEHLDYRVVTETKTADTTSGGVGIDLVVVKGNGGAQTSYEEVSRLAVTSPTDEGFKRVINDAGLVLVIDEMHQATPEFRSDLATFIKATRAGSDEFQLILIGTSLDAKLLVDLDSGIDRFMKETRVGLLTGEESMAIIADGFDKLKMHISEELKNQVKTASAGAPTIVQELCLNAAERAVQESRDFVTEEDFQHAVAEYLEENSARMSDRYWRAVETQGPKRMRKQILHAVANLDKDYATMDDIRTLVSDSLGEPVAPGAISGPLRALKEEPHGHILQGIDRASGGEIQNLTTFTDPMMKSFIRFMENVSTSGLGGESPA